jgi:hypothetical protein
VHVYIHIYCSAEKQSYYYVALCSDLQHILLCTGGSVTMCGQTKATTSTHCICVKYTLMLDQFVAVVVVVISDCREHVCCKLHDQHMSAV